MKSYEELNEELIKLTVSHSLLKLENRQYVSQYSGLTKTGSRRLKTYEKNVEKVLNISEDSGREGCTYGDTQYDSLSAVYGYNMCLEYVKDILKENIK